MSFDRFHFLKGADVEDPADIAQSRGLRRFGLRLLIGGAGGAILGLGWFVESFGPEPKDAVFTGGIWKGPLLLAVGLIAVIMGARMLKEASGQRKPDALSPDSPTEEARE